MKKFNKVLLNVRSTDYPFSVMNELGLITKFKNNDLKGKKNLTKNPHFIHWSGNHFENAIVYMTDEAIKIYENYINEYDNLEVYKNFEIIS